MTDKWVTYERAIELLGDSEYIPAGIFFQNVELARAVAAARRALKFRVALPALYDKESGTWVCPKCKEALERFDYEFSTGYCKVCGQKIEFIER